jgi:hypothetical protein
MGDQDEPTLARIDFGTIQQPLLDLAETMGQKMYREAPSLLAAPPYVGPMLFTMIRQAIYTCKLLFYINADERRENDCNWNPAYTFVTAPLIRNLIDCLYNVTLILENPSTNGAAFCKSGFKRELQALEDDETRYGGQPDWDISIAEKRKKIALALRQYNLTTPEVQAQSPWQTMGKYILQKGPGGTSSPHQAFLKTFTYGMWREYSAMAHGGFEGLLSAVSFYTRDAIPHELRPKMDDIHLRLMSLHMFRAAIILLCVVTEVQAYFRFTDANINARIPRVWTAMTPIFEAKELYDQRYAQLMADRGIKE